MKERIIKIIEYATDGNKAQFAERLGWTAQYLNNVIKHSTGIAPITRILQVFPEINARWLILGQGNMLDGIDALQNKLYDISVQMEQLKP